MLHTHHAPHADHHYVTLMLSLLVLMVAAILVPSPTAFTASNSAPVNLGPAINSAASDQQPAISPDGLSLYFASNRVTGSLGGFDIYVAQRARVADPWGAAVNVGPLNTTSDEGNPAFSRDGRFLFFQSRRPTGSFGGIDIWVAQRNNPRDDLGWQPAVNLGPAVNSAADDNGPGYFEDIARGTRQLYFGSTRPGLGAADIYVSEHRADGSFGPATLVTELSSASNENDPSIRHDGLEVFFQSNRTGSSGTSDVWVATRGSTLDAWSAPVNPGDTINTASVEQNPYLSSDGTTLFFASDRPSGIGGLDLYMSARTLPPPSWSYTGSLNAVRRFHTTTLLANGKVLVVGGIDFDNCGMGACPPLNSAELYDPATGTWTSTGNLNFARNDHTATLLPNGKVLVVGGYPTTNAFRSAELFDPATGTWSNTGSLNTGRAGQMAAMLPNGQVLIAGGTGRTGNTWIILGSAELYDPAVGTWSSTGSLNTGRIGTGTLLPNGKLLMAGGFSRYDCPEGCKVLNSAELYDSATKTWSSTGDLNIGRAAHSATLLPNGKLLVVGGLDGIDGYTRTAELYDPATGTWSRTGDLISVRVGPAVLLADGKVLIAGGVNDNSSPIGNTELYDPATGKFGMTAYLNTSRVQHSAVLLPTGKVLVAGGYTENIRGFIDGVGLKSAELYDPSFSTNANIIDDAKFYVQQHYQDFLNRTPDADGLAFWTNELSSCGANAQCAELKRINVSAAFFLSIEFQETGYFVYRVHKAAHGNLASAPVPINFEEFQQGTRGVGYGVVVGTPGWEQILESNKLSYLGAYEVEPEEIFTTAYPTSMTPAAFVDALFANAEVIPSASDRSSAINEFGSATTTEDILARTRALRRVADNSTLKQQEFNRAFVLMQYFGYLRRNPNDAPEPGLNFDGYNFWLNKLNQFNGNFINAEMVKAFITSTEYRQRFGQP